MNTEISNSQCWTILKSLAQKAGVEGNINKQDVEEIMKYADTNNDGKISYDEFRATAKDQVDVTEEQYLSAFKVISKNDGDDATISDDDITNAITDFLNGIGSSGSTQSLDNANNVNAAGNASAAGNISGNTYVPNNSTPTTSTNISIQPTVDAISLTGNEDLQALQNGRSNTLAALQEARNQKSSLDSEPAVVQANQQVATAETSYKNSLTALEEKKDAKTQTEKAVLEKKALKDENDKALQDQNEQIDDITTEITEKNEEITAKNEELAEANQAVTDATSAVDSISASEPQQSQFKKTERRTSKDENGQTIVTEVQVDDIAAYQAAHSAWQSELEAAEEKLSAAKDKVTETEAALTKAEAELTNLEMDLVDAEKQLAELEVIETQIDSEIYQLIESAEEAGEAVSEELKNVSSNLIAKYEAKQNLVQVRMEKTAQIEIDIAQLQANLSTYAEAISAVKAKEQAENMEDTANDPTKLQEVLDDPEISEEHKLQLLNIAKTENPDAVEEVIANNPDFYNNAISKIASADGNTMEDVTDAVLADAKAEIEQRRKEIETEYAAKGFANRIWDDFTGLFGFGTKGEFSDLDEIEQLYREAELNPTVENLEKLNRALYAEPIDWVATAQSVSTIENIQNGAYTVNGETVTQEQIADMVMQGVEGLEAGFEQRCDEAGIFTKTFSWLNNILGFGTTRNMTEAQLAELKRQVERLSETEDPEEFAALFKQITGQSLTEASLSLLYSGESNPVENSAAAESMIDYENTNDTLKTTAISICAAALSAIPGVGWIGAIAIGAAMNVGVNALDSATQADGKPWTENLADYAREDLIKDATVGAINGLTGKLGNAAGQAIKSLSQTASCTVDRIAGKLLSEFIDGAIDGSLSSGAEYVLDQIADGEEINIETLGEQMLIGGGFGGGMNVGLSTIGSLFKGAKNGDIIGEFAGNRILPDSWSSKGSEFEVDGQKLLEYDGSYFKYDLSSNSWIEMTGDELDVIIAKGVEELPDGQELLALPEGRGDAGLADGQELLALPEGRGDAGLADGQELLTLPEARSTATPELTTKTELDADVKNTTVNAQKKPYEISDVDLARAKDMVIDGQKVKVVDGKCYVYDVLTGKYLLDTKLSVSGSDVSGYNILTNTDEAVSSNIGTPSNVDPSQGQMFEINGQKVSNLDGKNYIEVDGKWKEVPDLQYNAEELSKIQKMSEFIDSTNIEKYNEAVSKFSTKEGIIKQINNNYNDLRIQHYSAADTFGTSAGRDALDAKVKSNADGINRLEYGGSPDGSIPNYWSARQNANWSSYNFKVDDRFSLNVKGSAELISELDRLMRDGIYVDTNGNIIQIEIKNKRYGGDFYYKTPIETKGWLTRQDPITVYCNGTASQELEKALTEISSKYQRGPLKAADPNSKTPWIQKEKNPSVHDVQSLISKAYGYGQNVGDAMDVYFQKYNYNASSGMYASAQKVLDEINYLNKVRENIELGLHYINQFDSSIKNQIDVETTYNATDSNSYNKALEVQDVSENQLLDINKSVQESVESLAKENSSTISTVKAKVQEAIEKLRNLIKQGADNSEIKNLYDKIQEYCSIANLKDLSQRATSIIAESGDEMLKRAAIKAAAGLATPSVGGEAPYVNEITGAVLQGDSDEPAGAIPTENDQIPVSETPVQNTPSETPISSVDTTNVAETPATGIPAQGNSNSDFAGIDTIDFSQDVNYNDLLSLDKLIFQSTQEYTTIIDADIQDVLEISENLDIVVIKEEPLIFRISNTNGFSSSDISDEYSLNVIGSSALIKELEQLMTMGTYTIEVNGIEQTIEVDDMTRFMFSTIGDSSKWNETDSPVTLYFEGDINEETLVAIEVIASKYARGNFSESEGVDDNIPFVKKYENPTNAQMEELHKKASEIDTEFADTILEQSNNLVGMSGLQYACALEIIEQYNLYLLNSIE